MHLKIQSHVFVILILASMCNAVNLTCEYYTASQVELMYISQPQYACKLTDEYLAINSERSEILGEHLDGKQNVDVKVLSIIDKNFYEIPDLSEKFTEILSIMVENTPLTYLENKHLVPYAYTLKYLVILGSKLEILGKNLFDQVVLLRVIDFRNNAIFFIHPDVFNGLNLINLLLQNNDCKDSELYDVGNFKAGDSTLADYKNKLQSSTCGTLNIENFISTYLSTKGTYDFEVFDFSQKLKIKIVEFAGLETKFNLASASLKNVTDLFNSVSSRTSILELQITALNQSNEECKADYDTANSTILELNSAISNLTSINENLTTKFAENNSKISKLQMTILSLNYSIEQSKSNYEKLNEDYSNLQHHTDELEILIQEVDATAEKCREVDGTCRFTNGTNGYTCIAHDVNITAPGVETTTIEWTGTHLTNSNNRNVLALLLRELDVHYMPTTIGSTFVDIKVLTVQKCGLKKLSKGDFSDLAVLKTLEITSNNIESIDSGVFDSLTSLESLDLSENKIKLLPSKVFVLLPQLKNLNLDKNDLTSLKADFLASSTKIEYFSAINNQLAKVESSFVWKMKNAKKIDLTGNGCGLMFDVTLGSFISFYSGILSKC